jgi:hypothetical protein
VPYGHDDPPPPPRNNKKKPNANAAAAAHSKPVEIFTTGSSQPLVSQEFPEMQGGKKEPGRSSDPLTMDKRYHFFPQLNLFLTIPPSNDKIVAHPFDVRQELDKRGIDYLYVTSSPPAGKISKPYRYKLEVASKTGGVTCALQSGPTGLTISKDGNVAWTPPSQPVDETVIVSVKDTSGQEVLHSFRVVTAP